VAFKTFVDAVALPASDLNTYLMKQAVIVCTSGTRPASPNEGMTIWETDTDKLLIYTTATTTWQPPWNLPWGRLGSASVTANQTSITTETDLTSLSVTVTVPANRRLRITGFTGAYSSVAQDASELRIKESTTQLTRSSLVHVLATSTEMHDVTALVNGPSSGSHTYKLAMVRTSGTGSITMVAASDAPAFILVEDMGPNSAPA